MSHSHSISSLFKQNFASGLVVFLVALPLCLGIALASGAPPLAGILSGIIGGVLIGAFSSSHVSVSGPAAGLAAIVLAAIQELGSFELFLCAGLVAGVGQILLGWLRAGHVTRYLPMAVIEGMLAGIGLLILMTQFPHALGMSGRLVEQWTQPEIHFGAMLISMSSLAVLLLWEKLPRLGLLKWLPAALIAVLLAILLNQALYLGGSTFAVDSALRVQLPEPHSLEEAEHMLRFPEFRGLLNPAVWLIGMTIAVVASIETLLSIEAADRLDRLHRITKTNHELKVQGVGNLAAAFIGGLPMTSVIVRSSANANAGATHKLSTIIHGVLLLICVLTLPHLLNLIPLAALAAVLMVIGYKLTRPSIYRHFWQQGMAQFLPFFMTVIGVVSFDLLKGVGMGLFTHLLFWAYRQIRRSTAS